MKKFLLLFIIFLAGCTTGQVAVKSPLYQYKPDIEITIDKMAFDGMAVAELGAKQIQIVSKARLDLLMISSCHRNFTIERLDATWFGGSKKKYVYSYVPTTIESEGFCPLYIQAFEKSGISAWGYIAFRTEEKLPGKLSCNGVSQTFNGISACATRAGFEQGIHFDKPVRFEKSELCEVSQRSPGDFRLKAKEGFCYITFSDNKDIHRIVLLGYTEALIRGE